MRQTTSRDTTPTPASAGLTSTELSKDDPTSTSSTPTVDVTIPKNITGKDRTSAKKAITVWRHATGVIDQSLMKPGAKGWKAKVRAYMADPAALKQLDLVQTFVDHDIHQVGTLKYTATVTDVTKFNVHLKACVDMHNMDVVDADGTSEINEGGPDRFYRGFDIHRYETKTGGWLVHKITNPDPVQPC